MQRSRKLKVSISLPSELVARIDRKARLAKATRSGVMEQWLRQAARVDAEQRLADEIRAYYEGQTAQERAEGEAWTSLAVEAWAEREDREAAVATRRRRRP